MLQTPLIEATKKKEEVDIALMSLQDVVNSASGELMSASGSFQVFISPELLFFYNNLDSLATHFWGVTSANFCGYFCELSCVFIDLQQIFDIPKGEKSV